MKTNGWNIFYWSLIVVGFAISLVRHSGNYSIPPIGWILILIGTICLQAPFTYKKDKAEE